MNCPICKCRTTTAKTHEAEGKKYQDIVCTNPRCPNYAGSDLNEPKVVIEIREV
jgi:hypothetical protein